MCRVAQRGLGILSALMIALYVFDVPRLVIEIWALPLPRFGGRPPYLLPFVAVLLLAMLSAGRSRGGGAIHPVDMVFVGALVLGGAVAAYHAIDGASAGGGLLIDLAVFYSGFLLVRAYRDAFCESLPVLHVLWWVALGIVGVHFLLLVLTLVGLPPLGARPEEIVQRNGISFLVLFVCFFAWFLRKDSLHWQSNFALAIFALVQILLNGSRGALVILILFLGARFVLQTHRSLHGAGVFLVASLVALVAIVIAAPTIQHLASTLVGSGDDRLSALSRLQTNSELFGYFLRDPFLGIGEAATHAVTFAGYPSHTFPIVLATAYGLFGCVPFAVAVWMMARGEGREVTRSRNALALTVLVLLFVNDVWPWLAAILAAAGLEERPTRPMRVRTAAAPVNPGAP